MATVVALARGFDVGVAILLDGLLRGGPEADGQVSCRRLEEGLRLLFRAWVRENQPSLVAHDHPAHGTPREPSGPDVAQAVRHVCPAACYRLGSSAVPTATTAPARTMTAALAPHRGKRGYLRMGVLVSPPLANSPLGLAPA